MNVRRASNPILLALSLAVLAALLVYVPPHVLSQYERISKYGTAWTVMYFVVVGLGASIFLSLAGVVLWKLWAATIRKDRRRTQSDKNPSELSRREREQEIDANLDDVRELRSDPSLDPTLRERLQALVQRLEVKRESQRLEIVAFGTVSSGKSSLLNALAGREAFQTDAKGGTTVRRQEIAWPGNDQVVLVDTPGLGEVDGEDHVAEAAQAAQQADVVLMVVDGPLRDAEHRLLTQLRRMEKRVLVCVNKADWYADADLAALRSQLGEQLHDIAVAEDIVSVRSQETRRLRTRVIAGGGEREEWIPVPPDITPLAERLLQVVRRDGGDLALANLLLQSRGLVEESKKQVREAIDRQAWQVVDRYTWGAGGAAALSMFPILDLIAGSALTAKMVVDLARIYRQDLDSEIAIRLLGQLAKNLIGILGVTALSPAVAAGVASVLKTVPGAGTIAGGLMQGLVQALITRWIGGVFIQYFQDESKLSEGSLAALAQREWQRLTSPAELYRFVKEARARLTGAPTDPPSPTDRIGR
jgi:small GTP-binding protein